MKIISIISIWYFSILSAYATEVYTDKYGLVCGQCHTNVVELKPCVKRSVWVCVTVSNAELTPYGKMFKETGRIRQ